MKTTTEGLEFEGDFARHAFRCIKRIRARGYAQFLVEEMESPSWPDQQWRDFIAGEFERRLQEEIPI